MRFPGAGDCATSELLRRSNGAAMGMFDGLTGSSGKEAEVTGCFAVDADAVDKSTGIELAMNVPGSTPSCSTAPPAAAVLRFQSAIVAGPEPAEPHSLHGSIRCPDSDTSRFKVTDPGDNASL